MSTSMVDLIRSKYDELKVGIDPEVDSWLLMKSPGPLLTILGMYLLFVLKIGPQFMTNRKPYDLQKIMIVYNAYQVIFSTWMCSRAFKAENSFSTIFNNTCKSATTETDRQFTLDVWVGAWWYFFSKIVDLLDTVFFVLRKKQGQVTFLHVYHHTVTALFSWGYLKYLPGEQGIVIGLLNSFVHIIMYFYYMLAAMGPKYQKYLWWKKYMTWVQLIQFCLMLFYLVTIVAMDCKLPRSLTFFFVGNCVIFLYLFGNFYRQAYSKKNKDKVLQASRNLLAEGDAMKRLIAQADSNNNPNTMDANGKSIKQE
ncbi:elongation of very long chain fatty acids protein 7-like [Hermetia illucens]|nr:elongation of very long chain fatty acids protein 7-like [Hermetia illucens]